MKYLKETVDLQETEILVESDGAKKNRFITGPFMMFNKQNRNGRVYPEKIMDTAVAEYKKDYIDKSRALGELNHPPGRVQVDPERACIMITELKKDGSYYMGKAKVLSTPLGKILEALLDDGVRVGVSSRGYGSVANKGSIKEVKSDFRLTAAADVVHDPSVQDAYVESLMENKEFILVNGILVESDYDRLQRIKECRPSIEYQNAVLEQFKNLLSGF
jgi:hypothetical protein